MMIALPARIGVILEYLGCAVSHGFDLYSPNRIPLCRMRSKKYSDKEELVSLGMGKKPCKTVQKRVNVCPPAGTYRILPAGVMRPNR